jgi:hypothetical protein
MGNTGGGNWVIGSAKYKTMKNRYAGADRLLAMLIVLADAALVTSCHVRQAPGHGAAATVVEHRAVAQSAARAEQVSAEQPAAPVSQPQSTYSGPCGASKSPGETGATTAPAVPADAHGVISDEALLQYAASCYDKRAMMFKHVMLGTNHGVRVVADFPCSDLCPQYTKRVIHYDVPVEKCTEAGGAERTRVIPYRIGNVAEGFCVPKVLAGAPHLMQP